MLYPGRMEPLNFNKQQSKHSIISLCRALSPSFGATWTVSGDSGSRFIYNETEIAMHRLYLFVGVILVPIKLQSCRFRTNQEMDLSSQPGQDISEKVPTKP